MAPEGTRSPDTPAGPHNSCTRAASRPPEHWVPPHRSPFPRPHTATRGLADLARGWSLSHPHLEPSQACPVAAGPTLSKAWVPVAHTSPQAALPQCPRLHQHKPYRCGQGPGPWAHPWAPPPCCPAARTLRALPPAPGAQPGACAGVGIPAVLGWVEPQQVFRTCSWAAGRGDQAWSAKPPGGARQQPCVCRKHRLIEGSSTDRADLSVTVTREPRGRLAEPHPRREHPVPATRPQPSGRVVLQVRVRRASSRLGRLSARCLPTRRCRVCATCLSLAPSLGCGSLGVLGPTSLHAPNTLSRAAPFGSWWSRGPCASEFPVDGLPPQVLELRP